MKKKTYSTRFSELLQSYFISVDDFMILIIFLAVFLLVTWAFINSIL